MDATTWSGSICRPSRTACTVNVNVNVTEMGNEEHGPRLKVCQADAVPLCNHSANAGSGQYCTTLWAASFIELGFASQAILGRPSAKHALPVVAC